MHRGHPVHPAGVGHRPRQSRGHGGLGTSGRGGGGGGSAGSTAQLVLMALGAATVIFFTTSLLVMDSPISHRGFGPSQFVARVGRTAAVAGVDVGLLGSHHAGNASSSGSEEAGGKEKRKAKAAAGGAKKEDKDVVKTWRANKGGAAKRKEQEEEQPPKEPRPVKAAAPSTSTSAVAASASDKAKPKAAAAKPTVAVAAPAERKAEEEEEEEDEPEEPEAEEEEEDEEALLAAEVEELEKELLEREREEEEAEEEEEGEHYDDLEVKGMQLAEAPAAPAAPASASSESAEEADEEEESEEESEAEEEGDEEPAVVVAPPPPPEKQEGEGKKGDDAVVTPKAAAAAAAAGGAAPASKKPPAPKPPAGKTCQAFLEEADAFEWQRDFKEKPIRVHRPGGGEGDGVCDVPCFIGTGNDYLGYDATYGQEFDGAARIKWTMESYTNYPDTEVERAHHDGFAVVMTPRLDAEVSCVYFGWAKWEDTFFNPMKFPPVPAKDKEDVAAAFISNCGAHSFRLKALEALQAHGVTVHSHGRCANNMPNGNKDDILPKIKFSLAFENSVEPDYVTEKFLQALNFGAVPVVIGAPNIQDFAPSDNSIVHIPDEESLPAVAEKLKYLMGNDTAYDEMLAWKVEGPSDQFLALIDIGTVHPECRLCQYLADNHRRGEMGKRAATVSKRPCACQDPDTGATTHHLRIRERHTFEHRSLFLEEPLTVERLHAAIHALYGEDHQPVWARSRPSYRKKLPDGSWDLTHVQLRIHRVYPSFITQREALYGKTPNPFTVKGSEAMDRKLAKWVAANPCGMLDVVFV